MRILFLSPHDPEDVHAWSGTPYHMAHGFAALPGVELVHAGRLVDWLKLFTYSKRLMWQAVGFDYVRDHSLATQVAFGMQVRARLARFRPDAVVGTHPLAFSIFAPGVPSAFWADASFASLVGYYPHLKRPAPIFQRVADRLEQRAIDNVDHALFSSGWAAEDTRRNYRVRPGAVDVVPYGANVEPGPRAELLAQRARSGATGEIDILFVGTEWERKGGDLALAIASNLRERGRRVRLHVVGCRPPREVPEWVTVYGFLSKTDPAQRERLASLYRSASFLLLPTRSEAAAVVLAEAAAYALPTITTRIGGNATIVRDGVTGLLLDVTAEADEFAREIAALADDRTRYVRMCENAADHFEENLNWASACRRVVTLLERGRRRSPRHRWSWQRT